MVFDLAHQADPSTRRPGPVQLLRTTGSLRRSERPTDRFVSYTLEACHAIPWCGEIFTPRPRIGGAQRPRDAAHVSKTDAADFQIADALWRELFQDRPCVGLHWVRAIAVCGGAVLGGHGMPSARKPSDKTATRYPRTRGRCRLPITCHVSLVSCVFEWSASFSVCCSICCLVLLMLSLWAPLHISS